MTPAIVPPTTAPVLMVPGGGASVMIRILKINIGASKGHAHQILVKLSVAFTVDTGNNTSTMRSGVYWGPC